MGFSNAEYLWLLLALPILAGLLFLSYLARKQASEAFRPARFRAKEAKPGALAELANNAGWLLAASLIVVASAGPYQNDKPVRVPEGSVHACFVVDVSRSMAAEDYREHMPLDAGPRPDLDSPWGSRLMMAKYQIEKIMEAIPGNQVCLVTYTERGFGQAILGTDFKALSFVLKRWVDIGTAPGDGSNYAKGMETALDILKDGDAPGKEKVIILLSDGGYTGESEDLEKTVQRLKDENTKLVIVGIGTPGEHAIPLYAGGVRQGEMAKDGKTITTSYEEDAIRQLKAQTGATYTHIALDAENQTLSVDWMAQISGSRIVYEKRPLDVYLAGCAYAIIAILILSGFFSRLFSRAKRTASKNR